MDSELDSILKQIDDILNNKKLDEETKKQVDSLIESLAGANKEAQNLKNN